MIVFDLHIRIKAKFFVVFQPFAWEAREYLRKKLIGKEVAFVIEYTVPGTGREYGCVYLGKGEFLFLLTKEHASKRNKYVNAYRSSQYLFCFNSTIEIGHRYENYCSRFLFKREELIST